MTTTRAGSTDMVLKFSSLTTSSTFLGGYESNEVASGTNDDFLVTIAPITGHASTAPAVGHLIAVKVWGARVSLATTAIDVLDGGNSTETISHASIYDSMPLGGVAIVTVATAGLTYYIPPFTIARLFGGVLPNYWGLFASHNHTGSLAASQDSLVYYETCSLA